MAELPAPTPIAAWYLARLCINAGTSAVNPDTLPEPWDTIGPRLALLPVAERLARLQVEVEHAGYNGNSPAILAAALGGADPSANLPPSVKTGKPIKSLATKGAVALMGETFDPLLAVVPGMLYEGCTLFTGAPKVGKSLTILGICLAVSFGGMVFGSIPVTKADVLYLSLEDGRRRLQRRLSKFASAPGSGGTPANLMLVFECPSLQDGFVESLDLYLRQNPATKLVVIDTLAKLRGTRIAAEKGIYQQDYNEVAPLTELAQKHRVALVIVHHTRKAHSDDAMDMVNASQGLAGTVDSVLVLQRPRFGADATLSVMGRDLDEEHEMALSYDPMLLSYKYVGNAATVGIPKLRQAVLAAFKGAAKPLSAKDIAVRTEQPYESTRQLLWQMYKDGQLAQAERGRYTLPTSPNNPNNANNRPIFSGGSPDPIVRPIVRDDLGPNNFPDEPPDEWPGGDAESQSSSVEDDF